LAGPPLNEAGPGSASRLNARFTRFGPQALRTEQCNKINMKKLMTPTLPLASPSELRRHCCAVLIFICLAALGLVKARADSDQFSGAIFTTIADGSDVNHNLYLSKDDVYLGGGPQNNNANGLPDGTYYFQVTDPSGAFLLSQDNATCRQIKVVGGKISGSVGGCAPPDDHPLGTLNSANGSTPVKVGPRFLDTPNLDGEYKVWLIRHLDADGNLILDNDSNAVSTIADDGIHINFGSKDSKTDNFKIVAENACLTVFVDDATVCNSDLDILNGPVLTAQVSPSSAIPTTTFTWTDPDGNQTIKVGDNTLKILNLKSGTYTVVVTFTDQDGKKCTASDSAEVTVLKCSDEGCSQLTLCPENKTVKCSQTDPSFTGAPECLGTGHCSLDKKDTEEGCGGSRTITRTWTCTNTDTGAFSQCTQKITVEDDSVPVIQGAPTAPVDLHCNPQNPPTCDDAKTGVTVADSCDPTAQISCAVSTLEKDDPAVPCGRTITFKLTATDKCGKSAEPVYVTYKWKIDTSGPEIQNLPAGGNNGCVAPTCKQLKAIDNCDGTLDVTCTPGPITGPACTRSQTFTYSVTDSCQKTTSKDVTYTWTEDTTPPTIAQPKDVSFCYDAFNNANNVHLLTAPTVSDNCTVKANWVATPDRDLTLPYVLGTTTITWSAVDDCGNPGSVKQKVTIAPCLCPASGGLTIGYWGNNNGNALLKGYDGAWRGIVNALNLKNANGTAFTVSTADGFATVIKVWNSWLQGANAVNMAYMLSAQLSATKLNTLYPTPNKVNPNAILFIPGTLKTSDGVLIVTTLSANISSPPLVVAGGDGYIKISDLINAAVTELGLTGHQDTTSGKPGAIYRKYQDALKTLFDLINNNSTSIKVLCPPPA
jgi:hypothetical protein